MSQLLYSVLVTQESMGKHTNGQDWVPVKVDGT